MSASFLLKPAPRKFLLRFFTVFFLVEVFLSIFPPVYLQEWLAQTIGSVLHVPVNGIFLSVNGIAFEISAFCTGITTWGLWLGLSYGFSFPRGAKKLTYALIGLAAILFVNFFRLLAIVYVGKVSYFAAVDMLHVITWFVMSALVMGTWYLMLSVYLKTTDSKKIALFLLHEKK